MELTPPVSPQANIFTSMATSCARLLGTSAAFGLAVAVVLMWAITGTVFHFSDTWQLVINTGTTIVTFLMVFLIQNSQNRDSAAIQLKLAEVIRCTKGAHNALLDLEKLSQEDLEEMRVLYEQLAVQARQHAELKRLATGTPPIPLKSNGAFRDN